ncbi:hypothetical protein NUH88_08270 [Nisaea acidiphila]|uniref:Antifreeze glycopeptide polyprotein n=1 Tax=Nisaea acidiphila TaxID=1862145 RepID=A0A9J7AZK5_9PROT|nr:hypothetical protein [Nisaea acidiphila]UUX51684.1 hypothetical protein NUH88_08270 [Nisaea acidiphila]
MISSRADRSERRSCAARLSAALLLVSVFAGGEAHAQGAPKPLLPALGAPNPLLAPAEPATPTETPTGQPAATADGVSGTEDLKQGITVDSLEAVSVETVGTIGAEDAALPASMWNGTPRSAIRRMLTLTGETPANATLRELLLRILLSPAAVPEADDPADKGTIVKARIDALERIGAWDDYTRLIDLAPAADTPTAVSVLPPALRARLKTDAGFLTGDTETSCLIAGEAMLALPEDRYWQKAGTFCQALADEWESVEFNLRLMLELGEEDTRFVELMRAVSGTASQLPQMPEAAQLRPLDIAMMRVAGVAPAMPDADGVPPALIPVLIGFESISFEDRLRLAERGERLGLVDRSQLVSLYELVEVDASQMDNALTVAAADPSANGRALLYRATAAQTLPLARAQAIQQALKLARRDRLYAQTARLYAPLIQDIPTTSPHSWFAADAAAAYIAAGMTDAADPWLALAEREARLGPEHAEAWRDAVIMARLAVGENVPLDDGFLKDWWQGTRNGAPEDAPARATLLFGLLEATGAETPGTVWRGLVDRARPEDRKSPPAALALAQQAAASAGRLGEGALLTVLSLSGAELSEFAPAHLTASVRALWDLGLEQDANRLALDIYLASAPASAAKSAGE